VDEVIDPLREIFTRVKCVKASVKTGDWASNWYWLFTTKSNDKILQDVSYWS